MQFYEKVIKTKLNLSKVKNKILFLIAGIALFIGILDLPYGYYQLLKWLICGAGAYGAYLSYEKKNLKWVWILGIITLIFNPLIPFHFVKESWKTIDLIAGVIFCVYFGILKKTK